MVGKIKKTDAKKVVGKIKTNAKKVFSGSKSKGRSIEKSSFKIRKFGKKVPKDLEKMLKERSDIIRNSHLKDEYSQASLAFSNFIKSSTKKSTNTFSSKDNRLMMLYNIQEVYLKAIEKGGVSSVKDKLKEVFPDFFDTNLYKKSKGLANEVKIKVKNSSSDSNSIVPPKSKKTSSSLKKGLKSKSIKLGPLAKKTHSFFGFDFSESEEFIKWLFIIILFSALISAIYSIFN